MVDGRISPDGPEAQAPHPVEQSKPSGRAWLNRGVASVGLASFFSDFGHEITTSAFPGFLTSVLNASAAALGVIEGVSDALTGVLKLFSGPLANDETRRLRMASGGYVVTAAATGAIGLATTVPQAAFLRATAWMARGVRSPARDAMLASLAPREAYGRAFGLERAGDNLGAVVGPLFAAVLVAWIGIRNTLLLATIPGLFAAVAITVAAAEARKLHQAAPRRARLELGALRESGLLRAFVPITAFELGNMATTLLILRSTELLQGDGRTLASATSLAIVIYAGHNLFASVVSYGGGHWIDRAGPRTAFCAAAALYAISYTLFALPGASVPVLVCAFLLAGSGIGLAETTESTLVARLLPDRLRGSGFGLLGGIQSFGDLGSSAVVGLLWTLVSPTAAFVYAASWMTVALVATMTSKTMRSQL